MQTLIPKLLNYWNAKSDFKLWKTVQQHYIELLLASILSKNRLVWPSTHYKCGKDQKCKRSKRKGEGTLKKKTISGAGGEGVGNCGERQTVDEEEGEE